MQKLEFDRNESFIKTTGHLRKAEILPYELKLKSAKEESEAAENNLGTH